MNKSKILRSVLTAVLTLVATTASALSFEVDGINYNDNGDGTVSVTYQGNSYDEYADEYTGGVVIPPSVTYSGTTYSVTSIGDEAFRDCSGLTSVSIPNSVTSIGYGAFKSCSGLTSVTIPNSVKSIDDEAFYYCSGLTSINIPNSVTSIGYGAFKRCSGLTSFTIPNSVKTIDGWAFAYCSGLTSFTIPNSVKTIDGWAFYGCSGLRSVTIGNSVTSIGCYAFYECSGLTSVSIPNSVTSIGYEAFSRCSGLRSVTIGNSVTSIDRYAFAYCSGLTSITIPNSVTSIGGWAFEDCRGLTRVDISSIEAWLGIKFDGYDSNPLDYAQHLYLNGEEVKDLVIPNSVTSIGDFAFSECSGLTSVSIPNSVTFIGSNAFRDCSGLTSVISKAVTPPTCDGSAFSTETYSVPLIVPSVAKEAYQAASIWNNFSNYVETDNKITAIAINNNEANLVIGNTLQLSATVSPEDATFADVLQWTSSNPEVATVDDNGLVTAIAKGDSEIIATTCDGSNLSASYTIKVEGPNNEALATLNALVANAETLYNNSVEGDNIGDYTPGARAELFASIESVKSKISESMSADEITACTNEINAAIQLFESKKVTTATSALSFEVDGIYYNYNGDGTVAVTYKGSSCSSFANEYTGDVVIPSSVTYSGTTYSVTSIGDEAFWGCSGLTSVTIPNSVTSIGDFALVNCSGLKSVTIPNSVTSIGKSAFSHCSGLESIVVESGNSKYDSRDNCNAIIETATNTLLAGCKNTTIPNSVNSIGYAAFWGCIGLTSVSIPNSVTSIGEAAFVGCIGLTSVTIPNSVTSIGDRTFQVCSGLESIVVESGNSKYDSRDNCNAIIETATNTLLAGCKNTTIPNTVTSIGEAAFEGCSGLTSVTIPNSVTSIGDFALVNCSGLKSVTIGNSVTSIGNAAFQDCSSLTSVTIPNSVTSIGSHAFAYNSGLTSVTIGNSVTSIGSNAFQSCSRLTSVTSKAVTPPTCGDGVFTAETYSVPLIVPSVAKEAYQAASTWSNFSNYVETDNKITVIAINNNEANLVIGNTLQLSATVSPEDATFADVLQWTSSNPEVATVDNNGLVTAIAKGDAEIIATTCDGSNLSASYTIKVDEALAALNALVAKAETLYNNSVEGDNIGDYTPGARAELFASIENVKSKISESMSADEITACTNEINAAIQLFESKKVTTTEDTNVSLYENIIFVENAEAFVGKSVTLSLKMNNTIVPVGFQCDFYAPSKTSVPTDEDGFYAIDLSTERTTASRHNIFESGLQKDGGIRILAASTRNYPFAGNEGEVVTITLNVDADLEEGEYPLILRNVIISDAQSNTYSVDYVKSTLTVSDYTPGDVNGDGSINIGDVTAVVSHIMGAETNVFIEKAADVTGDGSVNIGDLTGIVGMIIGGNSLAPATKAATKAIASPKTSDISGYDNVIYAKDVTFGEDGRATLSIHMKNSVVTPGFQFDIVMPEGIEIEKDEIGYIIELSTERTTTRKTNIFESGLQKDGSVRVLAASTKNTPFEGNDGEVCTVSLILGEGTAPGEYEVVLKNIIISDLQSVTYSVDKTTAIITVPGSINEAANVNELVSGANNVGFGLQGVKMHNGVLYACTTAESVNKSTPTLHGNNAVNMDTYEDRNFADFDQRDWVAISGLVDGFVGKELSYPFVATFAEGVLTPSETINAKADATPYTLNTFRAENILHGGYSNYAERDYKAYYVPARVNEVAKFMGFIETVDGVKYLYSNNAYGRKGGEGIKIEGSIADNSTTYSLLEGILVADATTKAGVKIIMLQDLGKATGVEGVDAAAARIYTAAGCIIIAAAEDGEAAVYDFTGRLIKSVSVASGNSTAVPVTPGYYIVKTETKTQSVVVK